jgi:hypothetical protein
MGEQVQVREGVWRTREGEEIEVRARDVTGIDTEWRWEGKRRGHYNTWRDDGTIHIEREQKEGDLVRFLRPLPEAEAAPEPQPVEIREGVWKMRGGNEIEVRAGSDFGDWPFCGQDSEGEIYWCRDGRLADSGAPSVCDLVTYLRPLPEPEPEPEPQPVELCAGVWKTRSGHEVEVRENIGQLAKDFPWRGALFGVMEIWRTSGRWMNDMHYDHRDLVEYVRPLPEPKTTTDTLAEIEGQVNETLQEALGQALERAHIDDMRRAIDAMTAERDRLQRELTDMANHAVELLESAQQARDERDLLAQRLLTKHSEKALQKQNAKQQIEINTLKDKLQDMTTDRDRLAGELANAQRLAADLRGEVDFVRTQKTAQEHELRAEIGRLQRELQQARIEIDAAGQQPAPADTSEQIERIWDEARERAVSEIIELLIPLQVATGTHAEAVLQILPAVIRRWMDGGSDDVE